MQRGKSHGAWGEGGEEGGREGGREGGEGGRGGGREPKLALKALYNPASYPSSPQAL